MCGIVGYIGNKDPVPILLKGLKRLEYRGYDSSGIALMDEDNLTCLLYTSPSPRDRQKSRMPSSA